MSNRAETGPMEFADDWTGVFIRGDNALMGYAPALRELIDANRDHPNGMVIAECCDLLELLEGCAQGKAADVQKLRDFRACVLDAPAGAKEST